MPRGRQSAQAQAAALHRASGGRLAQAGQVLLQLQRLNGNAYVQQVISNARTATGPEAAPAGQATVVLGQADDRYEQEADRAAAAAVGHAPSHHPAPSPQAGVESDARLSHQPSLQQYGAKGGAVDAPVAQALHRARGGGQPLPATLRWSMEQTLGADFSAVRVHTGAQSDQLNRSLQAAAFTTGQDIFFRRGAYLPASPRGTALLAHELTHVVQQRNLPGGTVQRYFDPPADPSLRVMKPAKQSGFTLKPPHQSKKPGWAISKDVVPAQEMLAPTGTKAGHKVTQFTALLTPGHVRLVQGGPTQDRIDPLGWAWVKLNEVRTTSDKLRYWVRFHLLNANLGGKGSRELHLVPTTKTANAQWDVGLERPMADALEGVTATPVYYHVELTYWNAGEAPSTYVDTASGRNYSPNIELFPRQIRGEWKRFQNRRWVDQTPRTVNVDKPRGIKGEDVELTTHTDLRRLGILFHIDQDILAMLQQEARTARIASYGDVRRILEDWAMGGATPKAVSDRQHAIYESDGYLRTALKGTESFKLKINNQRVPDDTTPEAHMFGPAVHAKSHSDLRRYAKAEGAVTRAYMMAQAPSQHEVEYFPSYEDFLWLLTIHGYLYRDKLTFVQQQWDDFKAANKELPPMRNTHYVPAQNEIRVVLQRKTQSQVVDEVRKTFRERVRQVTGPTGTVVVADELANAVAAQYSQLLAECFGDLTVGDADNVSRLASALLRQTPVRSLVAELNARLAAAPDMLRLNIAGTLPSHPFTTTLATAMAGQMQKLIRDEEQQTLTRPPPVPQLVSQPRPIMSPQLLLPHVRPLVPHARPMVPYPQPRPPLPTPLPRPPEPRSAQTPPASSHYGPSERHGPSRRSSHSTRRPDASTHRRNRELFRAVRNAVRRDPRYYQADEATRQTIERRMADVKKRWTSPDPLTDRYRFERHLTREIDYVLGVR